VGDTALYAAMVPFAARFTFLGFHRILRRTGTCSMSFIRHNFLIFVGFISLFRIRTYPEMIPKVCLFKSWMFYLDGCRYLLYKKMDSWIQTWILIWIYQKPELRTLVQIQLVWIQNACSRFTVPSPGTISSNNGTEISKILKIVLVFTFFLSFYKFWLLKAT
jgi:hypothetical protein